MLEQKNEWEEENDDTRRTKQAVLAEYQFLIQSSSLLSTNITDVAFPAVQSVSFPITNYV